MFKSVTPPIFIALVVGFAPMRSAAESFGDNTVNFTSQANVEHLFRPIDLIDPSVHCNPPDWPNATLVDIQHANYTISNYQVNETGQVGIWGVPPGYTGFYCADDGSVPAILYNTGTAAKDTDGPEISQGMQDIVTQCSEPGDLKFFSGYTHVGNPANGLIVAVLGNGFACRNNIPEPTILGSVNKMTLSNGVFV